MIVYRGDLLPDLKVALVDDDGPVDLSTASTVTLIGARGDAIVFSEDVVGGADGIVTLPLQAAWTADLGTIYLEMRVVWPTNKPQTFKVVETVDVRRTFHEAI